MVSMVLLAVVSFVLLVVWREASVVCRIAAAAARVARRRVRVLRGCRGIHRLLLGAVVCLVLVVVPRASHKAAEACCVHVSCCHRCGC